MDHFCDQLCIVRHDATDPRQAIVSFEDFETTYNKYHERDLRKLTGRHLQGKKVRYKNKNLQLVYQQFWHESNPYKSMIVTLWERTEKFGISPAKFDYLWRLTEFYMREKVLWKDTSPPLKKCAPFPFTDPRDPYYSKMKPAPNSRGYKDGGKVVAEGRNAGTGRTSSQITRTGTLFSIHVLSRVNLTAQSTQPVVEIERVSLFTVQLRLFNAARWKGVDWGSCLSPSLIFG